MGTQRTIGVMGVGEMGSAVGRALCEGGARVLTCVEGRSAATRQRAAEAGLTATETLADLVQQIDLFIAVVPSLAAEPLARDVAAANRDGAPLLYCDANSIGPSTARRIEATIAAAGGRFVDGSIIGSAGGLRRNATVYLSGADASEVAELLDPLRTSILGAEAGQASALKVLYAGMTKGLSALGTELMAGAERLGIRDLLLEKYQGTHPEVARFFAGNLPELPPRARRRAEEMLELTQTLEELGLTAHMARAAQVTLDALADRYDEAPPQEIDDLDEFVRWWTRRNDE